MARVQVWWFAVGLAGLASFAVGRFSAPAPVQPRMARPAPAPSTAAPWRAALDQARRSAEAGTLRDEALAVIDSADGDVALGDAVRLLGWVGHPEDHDLIESFARSGDPALEEPGMEALGRLGTDEAVDTLIAYLDDRERYEGQVLTALGLTGHPRAAEVLASRLKDPEWAWVAAQALSHFATPYAVERLAAAFVRADAQTAGIIARSLASLADDVPGASEALYLVLSGPRSAVRRSALMALAEAHDPMVFDLLMADIELPGPGAAAAVIALGQLGDPRAIPRLAREAREGSGETRGAAIQALAYVNHPDADKALLALVASAPASVAARAVHALPRIEEPAVVAALLDAARTRPRDVRQAVLQRLIGNAWREGEVPEEVLALARVELENSSWDSWGINPVGLLLAHGSREDWALVEHALIDGPTHVRAAAVWSLDGLNTPEAERLLVLLADDADANVRQSALQSMLQRGMTEEVEARLLQDLERGRADYGGTESMLVMLGTPRAIDTLMRRIEHGTRREWSNAISALASGGTKEHMEQLLAIADRTDRPELAHQILQSLVYTDAIPVERIVDRLLASDDPNLRATAAQALARTGTPEAKEQLVALLSSPDPQVASAALMSLGQVGGPEAEAALVGALNDPDLAWMAVSGLQGMGTPTAREALLRAARDGDQPDLRASVIGQLASLGGEDTDALLRDALDDDAAQVRQAAFGALESLGTSQAAETLAQQLTSGDLEPDEAVQVAMALRRMGGDVADRLADDIDELAPEAAIDTGMRGEIPF